MNQPENNNPPPAPSASEWVIPENLLSTQVDKEKNAPTEIVPDDRIKWFQMVAQGGETEVEKKEKIEAEKEQLRLGILKPAAAPSKPILPHQTISHNNQKIQGTFIPSNILDGISKPAPIQQQKQKKIGPNDSCLCGSGKKYKKCCMHKSFLK